MEDGMDYVDGHLGENRIRVLVVHCSCDYDDGAPLEKVVDHGGLAKPSSDPTDTIKENVASTSWSSIKCQFVEMGFSSSLVDRVIEENGPDDAEVLLHSLLTYMDNEKSNSELLCAPNKEIEGFYLRSEVEKLNGCQNVEEINSDGLFETVDKKLRLLEMGFSEDEISCALTNFGSHTPILELADSIFAKRISTSCNNTQELGEYSVKPFMDEDDTVFELNKGTLQIAATLL